MIKARIFAFSGVIATLAVFVACGDGEKNTADSSLGGASGTCPGATECGGVCVDTQIDPDHCGACDTKCADGESCSAGECAPTSCPTGLTSCSDECVNLKIDSSNCGACAKKCAGSEVCNAGKCEAADCPSGQVACDGVCVTLASDQNNCGACGTVCGAGELCGTGVCAPSCGTGLIACDNSCVNPSADPKYCGATDCSAGAGGAGQGVECGAKEACVIGECRMFTPTWAPAQQVDDATTRLIGEEQSIGMDSNGNAIILFRQQTTAGDDDSYRTFAMHYDASTKTFGAPIALHSGGTKRVRNLALAVGPNGDALAVWISGDLSDSQVMSASFNGSAKTWSSAVRLDDIDTATDTPDVAIDADGDAVVAWSQRPSGGGSLEYGIYVTRRVSGTFGAVHAVPRLANGAAVNPRVALNDVGDMAVVYSEQDDDAFQTKVPFAIRYSSGWSAPHDLRTATSQSEAHWGENLDVGIDALGNVTVVFSDDNYLTDLSIYESVFSIGSGTWSTATTVESLTGPDLMATFPRLAVEPDGSAFLVFQVGSYDGDGVPTNFTDVYGAVRASNGTWGNSSQLADIAESVFAANAQLRSDKNGNAFAFWLEGPQVKARRYVGADADWGGASTLASGGDGLAVSPDMAVGPNGNALASWIQKNSGDTSPHIYVARFD